MKLWLARASAAGAAAMVVLGSVSCSRQPAATPAPVRVEPQDRAVSPQASAGAKARDLELAAQLEIANLRDIRFQSREPERMRLIDRQIVEIERWREALAHDSTSLRGDDRARVSVDEANLERAVQAGASAEVQAPPPRAPAPYGPPAAEGDGETMPQGR